MDKIKAKNIKKLKKKFNKALKELEHNNFYVYNVDKVKDTNTFIDLSIEQYYPVAKKMNKTGLVMWFVGEIDYDCIYITTYYAPITDEFTFKNHEYLVTRNKILEILDKCHIAYAYDERITNPIKVFVYE